MATLPDPLGLLVGILNESFQSDAQIAEDGAIHLQFDDVRHVAIALSPDQSDLVFFSVLGPADGGQGIVRISAALALNLHQVATRGGAIGLDTEHQTLVFSWRLPLSDSEPPAWLAALDQFCATTQELHEALQAALDDWSDAELRTIEARAARLNDFDEDTALEATPAEPGPLSDGSGDQALPGRPGGPIRV